MKLPILLKLLTVLTLLAGPSMAMWSAADFARDVCRRSYKFQFDGCKDSKCLCASPNYVSSFVICLETYMPEGSPKELHRSNFKTVLKKLCGTENKLTYDDGLKYLDKNGYIFNTNLTKKATPNKPVLIDQATWNKNYLDDYTTRANRDYGVWQGAFMTFYLIVLCCISGISKVVKSIYYKRSASKALSKPNKMTRLWQKYISLPALFGFVHAKELSFWGINITLPTRMESIGIFGYFALALIFCFTRYYNVHEDNFIYGTKKKQLLRHIAARVGIIATTQLPILTLLALRNNFLMYISGWSLATFNAYHRAVSRVVYIMLIVHATVYHGYYAHTASTANMYIAHWYWSGATGIIAFGIAIGVGNFRRYFYDTFLIMHVIFVLVAFVATYYHVHGMGYTQSVYLTFALWAMDWLLRFCNIMWINLSLWRGDSNRVKSAEADMSLVGGNIVMNVKTPMPWNFKPGQFVFVYVASLNPWECHPFSLVSGDNVGDSFKIIAKAQNGLTKKLAKRLERTNSASLTFKIAVEGPYGEVHPVERYDSSLLIAGGVGVTAILPYAEKLSRMDIRQHTQFIWVVRNLDLIKICNKSLNKIIESGKVEVKIFVAGENEENLYLSEKGKINSDTSSLSDSSNGLDDIIMNHVSFGEKPSFAQMIAENFSQATGSMAVVSCGPGQMMDDIRKQVSTNFESVNGRVEYFEEAFNW
ncbi:hypothetical protein NADFUDRAFT_51285 [Nadsonia fulvescens var. elongata DSM 6958]|uniref:ferric-chelate reductase (NADPH) n=1 Tax=Nadsonia fulvescens var. elongata DSM 6958 TaxID=857566 RepID=A0A1E3PKS3_9ASCO|nr:hypothetical protein NADFUDRAFT_51285 [Nadsonia fulvescens var. elongata DSM 6958]